MQNPKQYTDFSVQDFILDEYFQDWVLHPNEEKEAFWRIWLTENPGRKAAVNEARLLLTNLRFRIDRPAEGRAEEALNRAWQHIAAQEAEKEDRQPVLLRFNRVWRLAAVWILVAATGYFLYLLTARSAATNNEVSTRYGQLDSLVLPDQSLVVLNANSSVQYEKNWDKKAPREVWLKGEAFFNVKHLNTGNPVEPSERFLVHVGRATIEVLGTSFNVRQRRGKIEVALLKGSIRLQFQNNARPAMLLKPGELVVMDTAFSNVVKSAVKAENSAAWTKKRLVLNNPTLGEIVAYLEDTYGKKIVLSNPELVSKRVEGPILLDSLEDALFVISTVLNVSIQNKGDTLLIQQR